MRHYPLDVRASTKLLHSGGEGEGGDVWIRMPSTSPLNRPTHIAEIPKTSPGESILPTLHNVQIHGMATNALVITGIEFQLQHLFERNLPDQSSSSL